MSPGYHPKHGAIHAFTTVATAASLHAGPCAHMRAQMSASEPNLVAVHEPCAPHAQVPPIYPRYRCVRMKGLYLSGLPDWRGADPSVSIEYRTSITWAVTARDGSGLRWARTRLGPWRTKLVGGSPPPGVRGTEAH
eukprot:scaffold102353_cov40-Phaeocystis_antarctica.AAC.2